MFSLRKRLLSLEFSFGKKKRLLIIPFLHFLFAHFSFFPFHFFFSSFLSLSFIQFNRHTHPFFASIEKFSYAFSYISLVLAFYSPSSSIFSLPLPLLFSFPLTFFYFPLLLCLGYIISLSLSDSILSLFLASSFLYAIFLFPSFVSSLIFFLTFYSLFLSYLVVNLNLFPSI